MPASPLRAVALAAAALSTSACGALHVGAGPGADLGTYSVGGLASGVGGHGEVGVSSRWDGTGPSGWLSLTRLGYASDGDADPIWIPAVEARWTAPVGDPRRGLHPVFEIGAGLGAGLPGTVHSVALPLHGGVGLVLPAGGGFSVKLAARVRPFLFVAGGSPPVDVAGSFQLGVSLLVPLRGR